MDDLIKARPVKEGKDPLAEGNTLYNPSNSEDETHYDLLESSRDVIEQEKRDAKARKEYQTSGHLTPQAVATPARRVRNKSQDALNEATKGRKGR